MCPCGPTSVYVRMRHAYAGWIMRLCKMKNTDAYA